jgi:hypothetical protein
MSPVLPEMISTSSLNEFMNISRTGPTAIKTNSAMTA